MALPGVGSGYQFSDGNQNEVKLAGGSGILFTGGAGIYVLNTAITANTTTTSAPAGSLGITSNATGIGKLFYSDGTKWQFMAIS
jgi:hypothetical protein